MGEPLGAELDELMVDPMIDELAKPIVEIKEQMVPLTMDLERDLAMLFGDDNDSKGPEGDEEVWEMDEEWLMAPVTPPPMPVMPPPNTYEVGGPSTAAAEGHFLALLAPGVLVPPSVIEDLCTRMGNLEYGHVQLVKKVIMVSDVEVTDSIAIGEIGLRVSTVEGQMQAHTLQAAMQHRYIQIQQLQTLVAKMSSRGSTLIQCILGMDRRLADLERRPLGPCLLDIYVGFGSRHLEIIMIGCIDLGTEECNYWGNFGYVVALEWSCY
uniref:Uncharacterized protein n=1 Tax=Tanacetum cinerariifolium TaxID=118510 RepID=A0A699GXM4_TANCI|nr:hypothetical protein [Tanacetum cinerariifolium]